MRRTLRTLALIVSLVVPGAATADSGTSLKVELRNGDAVRTWTVQCDPVAGSLPGAAEACVALAQLPDPTVASTETPICVQGFPEWLSGLRISGTIKGVSVEDLQRRDFQCWQSMAFSSLANALGVNPDTPAATPSSDRRSRWDRRRIQRVNQAAPTVSQPAPTTAPQPCSAKGTEGKDGSRKHGGGKSHRSGRHSG